MGMKAILEEVAHLNGVGTRLEGYADVHPMISKGLLGIAVSVRNAATLLTVLLATNGDVEESSKVH
jgi:hypothetical protein